VSTGFPADLPPEVPPGYRVAGHRITGPIGAGGWGAVYAAERRRDGAPAAVKVLPAEAFYSKELGEFILRYDAVRTAREPETALMAFLQSTYQAAADLGKWDRKNLECGLGEKGKPRPV